MAERSLSRKTERRDRRKQEILDVASRLFSAKGYENITLRAIAEELGYAHATLYRYFPDKTHLLVAICRETFDRLVAEFDTIAASSSSSEECLLRTSRGLVKFGLEHPQHFRIVFFGPEDRNGVRAGVYINEIGRPLFKRLISTFQAYAVDVGRPQAGTLLDAYTWWTAVFGMTQVLVTQGELPHLPSAEAVTNRTLELLLAGLNVAANVC